MFNIFISFIFISFIFWLLVSFFYFRPSRYSEIFIKLQYYLRLALNYSLSFYVVYILFLFLFVTNLVGNIPLSSIPTLFYSETLTISLLFWSPIIICVYATQLKSFIAHMLPYGSPLALMLFLPLVEIFSQLIRPLTLIIRLRTNLSSSSIMLYIFCYFTSLSDSLSFIISPVIFILFILEICISILQSYIFVTLISLYIVETN